MADQTTVRRERLDEERVFGDTDFVQFGVPEPEVPLFEKAGYERHPPLPISTNQPDLNARVNGGGVGSLEGTMSGLSGGATLSDIERIESQEQDISSLSKLPLIEKQRAELARIKEQERAEEGRVSAGLGAGPQGGGFSSAEAALFGQVQKNFDDRRKELGERMSRAFQSLDAKEIERTQARIDHLDDLQIKREQQLFDRFLAFENLGIRQQTARFNILKDQQAIISEIPEGETRTFKDPITGSDMTFTGVARSEIDPFFTGANITSLMKTIPEGKSRTVTDPNTGRQFTLQGFSQTKPNERTFQSTDDGGNVMVTTIDLTTNEIKSQVSAGKIGKTKAAPVSITLRQETGALVGSISDVFNENRGADGKVPAQIYSEQFDKFKKTGGGGFNDFTKLFPPTQELNVADPNALPFFQTSKDVLPEDEEEEESPFGLITPSNT